MQSMRRDATARLEALEECLGTIRAELDGSGEALVVAVSGGVDSMTLAVVAGRVLGSSSTMFHAVSPAVPRAATRRVERYAARQGWRLELADAGEFEDSRYTSNPVDRCYFCKSNLYSTISERIKGVIVSGTNLDDLGDYRPGLAAAGEHRVRHPYVEARITKAGVRSIARLLRLTDLAELPSAPCLASRIETGLRVVPAVLEVVDACENWVRKTISPKTIRCRVRRQGVVVELDPEALGRLDSDRREGLARSIATRFDPFGEPVSVHFETYEMGSAFVHAEMTSD